MDIKIKLVITNLFILIICIACSSSQLAQKNVDKNCFFSEYKLSNNPDEIAFHFKITLFEEDSTLSKRRIKFRTRPRPVTRYRSEEGYYSLNISYPGMIPQVKQGNIGYIDLDYLEEDTLKLDIWNSRTEIPPIPMKLGKSLEVVLYLNSADDY